MRLEVCAYRDGKLLGSLWGVPEPLYDRRRSHHQKYYMSAGRNQPNTEVNNPGIGPARNLVQSTGKGKKFAKETGRYLTNQVAPAD
jgi:hypothetical protein